MTRFFLICELVARVLLMLFYGAVALVCAGVAVWWFLIPTAKALLRAVSA